MTNNNCDHVGRGLHSGRLHFAPRGVQHNKGLGCQRLRIASAARPSSKSVFSLCFVYSTSCDAGDLASVRVANCDEPLTLSSQYTPHPNLKLTLACRCKVCAQTLSMSSPAPRHAVSCGWSMLRPPRFRLLINLEQTA